MKVSFDILFEVVFEHEYFIERLIPELDIEPSLETQELLRNYGLLFKGTGKGFVVLYEKDTSQVTEPPLRAITSDEKFSFEIFITNRYFTNYTQIPLDHKSPYSFYFDNLAENISGTDLLLNKQTFADETDIVQLNSDLFKIEEPSANTSALIQISDLTGTIVLSKTVTIEEGLLFYQVDFKKIGSGRYDIMIDGSLFRKLYVDSVACRKPLFGILDIYTSGGVPPVYRFVSGDGTVNKKIYRIRFARRTTTWKYFIILRSLSTDPGLTISYGPRIPGEEIYPDAIIFNSVAPDPELIDEYGPGKVLLFESDYRLPLYEVPKTGIRLIKPDTDDPGSDPDIVIDNLPNAVVSAIKTDSANTETFSEIFIYV